MSVHDEPLLMPPYTELKRAIEARGVTVPPTATPHMLVRLAIEELRPTDPARFLRELAERERQR